MVVVHYNFTGFCPLDLCRMQSRPLPVAEVLKVTVTVKLMHTAQQALLSTRTISTKLLSYYLKLKKLHFWRFFCNSKIPGFEHKKKNYNRYDVSKKNLDIVNRNLMTNHQILILFGKKTFLTQLAIKRLFSSPFHLTCVSTLPRKNGTREIDVKVKKRQKHRQYYRL